MLTVTVQKSTEGAILRCVGRVVRGDEADTLCNAVLSAHDGRVVVVDLAEVYAIDGGGLGLLLSLQASGIHLKLQNPSRHVREVLRLTSIDSVLEIHPSDDMGFDAIIDAITSHEPGTPQEFTATE